MVPNILTITYRIDVVVDGVAQNASCLRAWIDHSYEDRDKALIDLNRVVESLARESHTRFSQVILVEYKHSEIRQLVKHITKKIEIPQLLKILTKDTLLYDGLWYKIENIDATTVQLGNGSKYYLHNAKISEAAICLQNIVNGEPRWFNIYRQVLPTLEGKCVLVN